MEEHALDYVVLREVSDPSQLAIYESVLEAAEIPFQVQGEHTMGVLPVGGVLTGDGLPSGLRAIIHVPQDRLAEAEELLSSAARPEPGEMPGPESDD